MHTSSSSPKVSVACAMGTKLFVQIWFFIDQLRVETVINDNKVTHLVLNHTEFMGQGITDSPLCRACMEAEETPIHVMLQCNGVAEQRAAHLGSSATLHEALGDLGGLLSFWSELGWLE
ncbi:jg12170 [Pararge aegeria aegeria]|uniref:Jg12170 protein n=1 Tax=Pararge aegeria aegeria TaxID=348720 RepID=A0A8S4RQM8_9NEOP|nr:jg12170 [Pararge aegeria aegeria]